MILRPARRPFLGLGLVVLLLLVVAVRITAAPVLNYTSYASGIAGSTTIIWGSGFASSQGGSTVTFGSVYGTTYASVLTGDWSDSQIGIFVPTVANTSVPISCYVRVYVDVNNVVTPSNSVAYTIYSYNGPDVRPHGNYSTSTDFCLTCHDAHSSSTPYAILSQATVQEVCATCHVITDTAATGGIPNGWNASPPVNPGFSSELVATVSHYKVFINSNPAAAHVQAYTNIPISQYVTLSYLSLNTSGYESTQYQNQAPSPLYCGDCHTPHGNYSANMWPNWDTAQFSQNYGYNVGGTAQTTGHDESWLVPSGAMSLTSALLLRNPGHQGGIGNPLNASNPNPYIPVRDNNPIDRGWQQSVLGSTNNNLGDFCLGCHNLASTPTTPRFGDWDGMMRSHPMQSTVSNSTYSGQGCRCHQPLQTFAPIDQGCLDCHGDPLTAQQLSSGGNTYYQYIYPTPTNNPNNETNLWDFPHTSANPDFLHNASASSPYADSILCEVCHYNQPP